MKRRDYKGLGKRFRVKGVFSILILVVVSQMDTSFKHLELFKYNTIVYIILTKWLKINSLPISPLKALCPWKEYHPSPDEMTEAPQPTELLLLVTVGWSLPPLEFPTCPKWTKH